MEYAVIAIAAFGSAMLTFFSGFGLGTILMPVFALFFPVHTAIALTALVHLANNVFKMGLVWKGLDVRIALRFALPAALMAVVGAILLNYIAQYGELFSYSLLGRQYEVTPLKLIIAILMTFFAVIEIDKRFDRLTIQPKYLPIGGAISGFFGGLSGHQGALRSLFLLRAGLSKEGFIATGIATAITVDICRLSVYGAAFLLNPLEAIGSENSLIMVATACGAAFAGSFIGSKLLKKITFRTIQLLVGVMILIFSMLLGMGVI